MRFFILMILFMLATPSCTLAEWKGIKIIVREKPPFSFKNSDSITGFSIEIVEQLFNDTRTKQEGKTEIWPWARALSEIKKAPNILIPVMHRNKERNDLLNWVGPISPREIWLYKLTGRDDIEIFSLEDAKSYQVGVVRKSSSANFLLNNGFIENTNLQLTNLGIQNVKKLSAGRICLAPFNEAEMAWHLRKLTPPATMKMVTPVFLMSVRSQYYIALSKQVPDSMIFELQKALDQMKQDGRYKKIWEKYMELMNS